MYYIRIPYKRTSYFYHLKSLRTFPHTHIDPPSSDPCCVPLPSEEDHLAQRQRAAETAVKDREWVTSIFDKATTQLKDSYLRFAAKGQIINKLPVVLDLNLSYRLLCDHLSYDDGNIADVAKKVLHDTFESYKIAFAKENLDLNLLLILA